MQKILALVGSELDNYPTSQKYNVTSNTIQTEIAKQEKWPQSLRLLNEDTDTKSCKEMSQLFFICRGI